MSIKDGLAMFAFGGLAIGCAYLVYAQPATNSDSVETQMRAVQALLEKVQAERTAYKAVAEGDGWTVIVSKPHGVWCVSGFKNNFPMVSGILYDQDRTKYKPDVCK